MPESRHLLLQDTALRYFHEVAQCGSLSEASARLHVAASAISRQIAALEERLGTPLFDRAPTGLRPTRALALILPWAEQAQEAAVGLLRQLSQVEQQPTGSVRLAVPPAVGSLFLAPALPKLRAAFPELVVELAPATALVDVARQVAPGAFVVVSHLSLGRRPAIAAVRAVAEFGVPTFYAGNAFIAAPTRHRLAGTYLGDSLREAVRIIETALAG